jgi:metal-responsive CopG/Arc/MetJ family transcriptional regulator
MKRGSVTVSQSQLIALWVPRPLVDALDYAVQIQDTDRSKFIRQAVRHKIEALGIREPPPVAAQP